MKQSTLGRREAIAILGAAGAAFVAGCSTPSEPTTSGGTSTGGSTNAACAVTPSEVVGPFPSLTDLVRSDIREGRNGTALTLTLTVVNTSQDCAPSRTSRSRSGNATRPATTLNTGRRPGRPTFAASRRRTAADR